MSVGGTWVSEQAFGVDDQALPAVRPSLDGALVDQHLHQLFHVEGVAFGAAGDELAQGGGHLGQLLEQLVGQQPAAGLVQRLQVDALVQAGRAAPVRAALEQRGPREGQHQQRHVAVDLGQVVQEVQALVVGPVQVFELQHDRASRRSHDAAEQLRRRVEGAVRGSAWGRRGCP